MATTVTIGGNGTLFVGEDKVLRLELLDVAGVPVNMAGWSLVFDVRKTDKSPDPPMVSLAPSVTGVYDAVRTTNTQRAEVTLTDTHMNLFKEKQPPYRHSWKRTDDGSETVLSRGDFYPEKATAP